MGTQGVLSAKMGGRPGNTGVVVLFLQIDRFCDLNTTGRDVLPSFLELLIEQWEAEGLRVKSSI
jgi:hypothetical protein